MHVSVIRNLQVKPSNIFIKSNILFHICFQVINNLYSQLYYDHKPMLEKYPLLSWKWNDAASFGIFSILLLISITGTFKWTQFLLKLTSVNIKWCLFSCTKCVESNIVLVNLKKSLFLKWMFNKDLQLHLITSKILFPECFASYLVCVNVWSCIDWYVC